MMKKKILAVCMTLVVLTGLLGVPAMAQTTGTAEGQTPAEGCVYVDVPGSYLTNTQAVIDRVNAIRQEACLNGYVNPDSGEALTAEDYVPIRWSAQFERIARIRASEAGIALKHKRLQSGHKRLKFGVGQYNNCFEITCSQEMIPANEVIAYNTGTDVLMGIEQWYSEKAGYIKENGYQNMENGHYAALINPNNTYIGLATFYADSYTYPNTTLAWLGQGTNVDETQQPAEAACVQKVEIHTDYLDSLKLYADSLSQGGTAACMLKATISGLKKEVSVTDYVTFTSSDPTIIAVDAAGTLTGIKQGTATITATAGGKSVQKTITVQCAHAHTEVRDARAATTTKWGYTGDTYCKDCQAMIAAGERIPKLTGEEPDTAETEPEATVKAGQKFTVPVKAGKLVYQVNKDKKSVTVLQAKNIRGACTIPATVKYREENYPVTAIAANAYKNQKHMTKLVIGKNIKRIGSKAFFGCKKLKTITIKTTALKKGRIGKLAFSKIAKKATIKVPASKRKLYQKLLKAGGVPAKAAIKK